MCRPDRGLDILSSTVGGDQRMKSLFWLFPRSDFATRGRLRHELWDLIEERPRMRKATMSQAHDLQRRTQRAT